MMDLRTLTLLVVIFGVVYSHTTPQNDDFSKIIEMMTKLQEHVTNLENQQQELKVKVMDSLMMQNEKSSNFEVKVMDSMAKQDEKFSNFEGEMKEQYDQIQIHLQVDDMQADTINYYYGCDNSTTMPPSQPPVTKAQDCTELYSKGLTWDGVFVIQPMFSDPLNVYCQNGWTVLQKRTDNSIDYKKTLEEYGRGFGDVANQHWIGLNAMHELTEQGSYTVRFEFEDFDGETAWAEYSDFHVGSATEYTLTFDVGSYRGTLGDSLGRYNNGMEFSTFDVDRDTWSGVNCSTDLFGGGGWWFYSCGFTATTGAYGTDRSIYWYDWKSADDALKSVIMKIKRD